MSELSNYLENKLLDHFLKVASFTVPSALYLALYTSAPTDAGGGTEVSGGGYARQPVTFGAASSGTSLNAGLIEWPNTSWSGTVVAVGLLDAISGGNLLCYTPISPSLSVSSAQPILANIGAISVGLD